MSKVTLVIVALLLAGCVTTDRGRYYASAHIKQVEVKPPISSSAAKALRNI